jgi:hypothetical protein
MTSKNFISNRPSRPFDPFQRMTKAVRRHFMRTLFTGIIATCALCGLAFAQETTPATAPETTPQTQQAPAPTQAAATSTAASPRIAPGSVIPVQLTKSIDVKKLKTGDQVEAKVTQDLKAGNGEIIVAKDTKVVGHVTEAQARSKEQKESQVGIAFDRAVMKTGGDVNLPMSIQAIIAPTYLSANNGSGAESTGQQQSAGSGTSPSATGRNGNMGASQPQTPTPSTNAAPTEDKTGNAAHEPVTGNTQGVLGIPDLTLSTTAGAAQGSVLTSDKNNVKLESGTLMLLRVNQPGLPQ